MISDQQFKQTEKYRPLQIFEVPTKKLTESNLLEFVDTYFIDKPELVELVDKYDMEELENTEIDPENNITAIVNLSTIT